MNSRLYLRAASSVLFVLLLGLAFLAAVPVTDARATSHGDAHEALAPLSLPQSLIDISGPAGSGKFGTTVAVLPNGNFVVTDPNFSEGGKTAIGAVYLYSGATQTLISKLKGSTASDHVGAGGVTVLANGNYVVNTPWWDSPTGPKANVGAVTWCSATTGCTGVVTTTNSLVGGTVSDQVGFNGVIALTNGNYVVASQNWDNPDGPKVNAGAVTWGNGSIGTAGVVTTTNSLYGGTANDYVGYQGVRALTNGSYVVMSPFWDNPAVPTTDVGAVTWGNGSIGTAGVVTTTNSLYGGTAGDYVGYGGVRALTNGNYVVPNHYWDNPDGPKANAGAVTWGNGTTGTTGLVSASNSLIGATANDHISDGGVIALTNGNYVVVSAAWFNPVGLKVNAGAVTWGNGMGGTTGVVTTTNSLYGGTAEDWVGGSGVIALTNGNYVVASGNWDNPNGPVVDVGAATWGNGATGTTGLVSTANSLYGSTTEDWVGTFGVEALTNGNYIVISSSWDNTAGSVVDAGAVTFGNGTTGTSGPVSGSNSLIGSTAEDWVGTGGVTALTNGNYVVISPQWDDSAAPKVDVGAVTWCSATGCHDIVSAANSLVGSTEYDQIGYNGVTALPNGNYVVISTSWDNPTGPKVDVGAVTWCSGASRTTGMVTAANSLVGGTEFDQVGSYYVTALPNGSYVVNSDQWDNPEGPVLDAGAMTWGSGVGFTTGLVTFANSVPGTVPGGISGFSYDASRNRLYVGRANSNAVSILSLPTMMLPLIRK